MRAPVFPRFCPHFHSIPPRFLAQFRHSFPPHTPAGIKLRHRVIVGENRRVAVVAFERSRPAGADAAAAAAPEAPAAPAATHPEAAPDPEEDGGAWEERNARCVALNVFGNTVERLEGLAKQRAMWCGGSGRMEIPALAPARPHRGRSGRSACRGMHAGRRANAPRRGPLPVSVAGREGRRRAAWGARRNPRPQRARTTTKTTSRGEPTRPFRRPLSRDANRSPQPTQSA